jgi:hypothetical protein
VGDYELLRDAYIEPWSVFQRVDVEHFVGREWLVAEVDAFLAAEDRGYFILEAPAGVGKTAFLAHLAAHRGYIHHFVELARGPDGLAAGLKSLAAQLVRASELVPYIAEEVLPPAAGSRPDFFAHLLKRASDRLTSERQRLVIVVDALDEAAAPVGHNTLGLPEVLPRGVFFIVSQRPVPVRLDTDAPVRVFPLAAEHERNLADMRRFLSQAVAAEPVATAVRASNYDPAAVVAALLERSAGVWIYLHYVLLDIGREQSEPLDLDVLPDGIWDYYARFWRRWRDERREAWFAVHLPLLATLSVIQEDASSDLLGALADLNKDPSRDALLDEDWRPFLAVSEGDEARYRPYHASFREFLEGRLDREGRRAMDRALARELAAAHREAHTRIADRYLSRWGGLEAGLPELSEDSVRLLDGGYGFRHLTAHLAESGRHEELDRLLQVESVDGSAWRNTWFAAHDATGDLSDYLADLTRAWRVAETHSNRELSLGSAPGLCREARFALMTSSVNALAGSIPPPILVALVRMGAWSPAKGLAYARQVPNEGARADALAGLAPLVPPELQPELLGAAEALDEEDRGSALADLVEHLPGSLLSRAARALDTISTWSRATATARLAARLGRDRRWDEALAVLSACPEAYGDAIAAMGGDLPPDRLEEVLKLAPTSLAPAEHVRALLVLRSVADAEQAGAVLRTIVAALPSLAEHELVHVLADIAPEIQGAGMREAVRHAKRVQLPWARARSLALLAARLPDGEREAVVLEALAAARAIDLHPARPDAGWGLSEGPEYGLFQRADALGSLLAVLADDVREQVREEAVEEARSAFDAALEAVRQGSWSYTTASSSASMPSSRGSWVGAAPLLLARRLPPTDAEELVETTLAAAAAIAHARSRVSVLVELLPHVPEARREEVLMEAERAAGRIRNPEERCRTMLPLLADVDAPARPRLVEAVMACLRQVDRASTRLWLLGEVARFAEPELLGAAVRDELAHSQKLPALPADYLESLAPHLPPDVLGDVLAVARVIDDRPARNRAIAELAPYLEVPQPELAVSSADGSGDERSRRVILGRLARRFAAEGDLQQALRVADALPDPANVWPSERATVLEQIALTLATSDPAGALESVRRISRDDDREHTLVALLPELPDASLDEAEAIAAQFADPGPHSFAVFALARRLDELGRRDQAIASARSALSSAVTSLLGGRLTLSGDMWVGRAIVDWLAERLPAGEVEQLRESLQHEVAELPEASFKDLALRSFQALKPSAEEGAIAPAVGSTDLSAAENASGSRRAQLVTEVADQLDAELARHALALLRDVDDDQAVGGAVAAVAARLVALGLPEEATAAVLRLSTVGLNWDDSPRTVVLTEHTGRLAALGYLDDARAAALELPETNNWGEHIRAAALTDLAPRYVRAGNVRAGLDCALAIRDDDDRSQALGAFTDAALTLPAETLLPTIRTVLGRCTAMTRQSLLADLGALGPIIASVGGEAATQGIVAALHDVGRWWP